MDDPGLLTRNEALAPPTSRLGRIVAQTCSTLAALALLAGLFLLGRETGWKMPRASSLFGAAPEIPDAWCDSHNVSDAICVECNSSCLPKRKEFGWCRDHGVHECPICHPEIAQTPEPARVSAADRERAERALRAAPRAANNSRCKLQQRRIQFASADVVRQLGIALAPVREAPVAETIEAPGEIVHDPTSVVQVSARTPGTIWRVLKPLGARVQAGEVLALVDAPAVGKAKLEYQQALLDEELRRRNLEALKQSDSFVAGRTIVESETALQEARVRRLTAELALAALGMPVSAAEWPSRAPAEIARRLQFLGLPAEWASSLARDTASNNLLALTAPAEGEIVQAAGVVGEACDPQKLLFTIAEPRKLWLMLHVKLEDVPRLRAGIAVRFQHEGHTGWDSGTIAWISPTADPRTRAVPVRVELPNAHGKHHAHAFGTSRVIVREEPRAVVVPSSAVHWEGDCHVVFVRDRHFEGDGAYKLFHVRKVRPGASEMTPQGPITEIAAGLLPGEMVAATNSGILRTELLKNNLGAG